LPLKACNPSNTDTAVLFSAAILQLPSGLFLSAAKGPIKAIFCPSFFRGSKLFLFFNKTIDFLAISRAASLISLLPVISFSLFDDPYKYCDLEREKEITGSKEINFLPLFF
jgi:hypothetical protein